MLSTLSLTTAVPPAAVACWPYGGDFVSDLTDTSRAGRLVYAGSYPQPTQTRSSDEPAEITGPPGQLFHGEALQTAPSA